MFKFLAIRYSCTCVFLCFFFFVQCNHPHSSKDVIEQKTKKKLNVYYDTFSSEPKHLDPALSYSSNEYTIIAQIYEPPLQYDFLKRPYQLIPLSASKMPSIAEKNGKVVYTISLRKDLKYEAHPAFSKKQCNHCKKNEYIYHLDNKTLFNKKRLTHPNQLTHSINDTRNVLADDFIYQIKRMAHPQIQSPVKSLLEKYIVGFSELAVALNQELKRIRQKRAEADPLYNQHTNEKDDPIHIDLRKFDLKGVKKITPYEYEIHLKQKYPQFIYWLAMPFFAPMPYEVIRFYEQKASVAENFSIDKFPVGSGAFSLTVNESYYRMILTKNPHFHEEYYPI